jgi:hypothetical protein
MEQNNMWKVEHDENFTLTRQQFINLIQAKVMRNSPSSQLQQDDQRDTVSEES